MPAPTSWLTFLHLFAPCFTRPGALLFKQLVTAWALCPGRRTLTRLWSVIPAERHRRDPRPRAEIERGIHRAGRQEAQELEGTCEDGGKDDVRRRDKRRAIRAIVPVGRNQEASDGIEHHGRVQPFTALLPDCEIARPHEVERHERLHYFWSNGRFHHRARKGGGVEK